MRLIRLRWLLVCVGIVLLGISAVSLGSHFFGHGRAGAKLSNTLPPGVGLDTTPAPTKTAGPTPTKAPVKVVKKGIPVSVTVVSHGVRSSVSSNRLNSDGSLFVPSDPRNVSWWSGGVAPGSAKGTIVLVSHINYNGVQGAFWDLSSYRVGQVITVTVADGRKLKYAVAAPAIEVNKSAVNARRAELYDQTHSYGLAGQPKSGRLLLLSCGGVFDNRTGHYESNIFVYALPV